MGNNENDVTVYIDGHPVWEIGLSEVEPTEPETQTGPLPSVVESAKAELMAKTLNPELVRNICRGFARLARIVAENEAIKRSKNTKYLHYYKNNKKLRVRKKYRKLLTIELYEELKASEKQKEADE